MQRMVKPLVNGPVPAFVAILSIAVAILAVGLSYWLASSDLRSGPSSPGILGQALLLAAAVLGVVLAIWSTWSTWGARFFLRLERRRQAAAGGSSAHTFLATEQPASRTVPLALPVTIGIRAMLVQKQIAWLSVAVVVIAISVSEALVHGVWDLRFFVALLGALLPGSFFVHLFTGGGRSR